MSRIGRRFAQDFYPLSRSSGGGSVGGGTDTSILWDPSQPSLLNRVRTWAEVMSKVALSFTPITVIPKGACAIPQSLGSVDVQNMVFSGSRFGDFSGEIQIGSGTRLRNLAAVTLGTQLYGESNTDYSLEWDPPALMGSSSVLEISRSAYLDNDGTHPLIHVANGQKILVILTLDGSLSTESGPLVHVDSGGTLFVGVQNVMLGGQNIHDATVEGDVGGNLLYLTDSTFQLPIPSQPGFLGTTTWTPQDGFGGSTASRPTNAAGLLNLHLGTPYYDTDLAKFITWNGTLWVDANGVPV